MVCVSRYIMENILCVRYTIQIDKHDKLKAMYTFCGLEDFEDYPNKWKQTIHSRSSSPKNSFPRNWRSSAARGLSRTCKREQSRRRSQHEPVFRASHMNSTNFHEVSVCFTSQILMKVCRKYLLYPSKNGVMIRLALRPSASLFTITSSSKLARFNSRGSCRSFVLALWLYTGYRHTIKIIYCYVIFVYNK